MKKISFILFLFLFQISAFAQNKKGQREISIPLHPWVLLTGTYYIQYEQFHNPTRSTTINLGYNGNNIFYWWTKVKKYQGVRADIGQRWYLKGAEAKYIKPFVGVNATFEYANLKLQPDSKIPMDSLQVKGLCFAPEINAGIKFVAFKRVTFTPSLGLRYYINTVNDNKITKNPQYWAYNDWDNPNPNWETNRKASILGNYRRGFLPIPYINFGFVFKL
ncbi:MAG: hypothetical protein U5M51_04505 [Emticicia sp.]|nr:hypothetical protein [Emticicia sp.]